MISQIELIGAIVKHLAKRDKIKSILPRQYNAIIAAADKIIEELERPYTPAVPGMNILAWLACDDVGASSKFMSSVMWGGKREYAHPLDSDDFGRCHKFLEALPGSRERMPEMAVTSPAWAALVAEWQVLTVKYLAGDMVGVTERIRQIESENPAPPVDASE